ITYVPFLLGGVVCALFGGLGSGLTAALLSAAGIDYFLLEPVHSLHFVAVEDAAHLAVFLAAALLVCGLVRERGRRLRVELTARARDELILGLLHDLRAPLRNIASAVAILQRRGQPSEFLDAIDRGVSA